MGYSIIIIPLSKGATRHHQPPDGGDGGFIAQPKITTIVLMAAPSSTRDVCHCPALMGVEGRGLSPRRPPEEHGGKSGHIDGNYNISLNFLGNAKDEDARRPSWSHCGEENDVASRRSTFRHHPISPQAKSCHHYLLPHTPSARETGRCWA